MRRWILVLAVVGLVALPDAAHACAVCFDGPGETRRAFFATTAFLTLLPLGMLAGAGAWLRSKARQADEAEGTDPQSEA